jgi:hypothetical protein
VADDPTAIKGEIRVVLRDANGRIKLDRTMRNLVTTVGDQYYAQMGCAGIGGNTAPTLANGMKLGTATTAVHKSTAGAANIANGGYITGSNNVFDTVTVAAVAGTNTGYKITYVSSWAAGDATNSSIQEVAIVTDRATDNTSTGASVCIARALTGTINKAAADTLTITWIHTFLGA